MPVSLDLLSDVVDPLGVGAALRREVVLEVAERDLPFETLDVKVDASRSLVGKPSVPTLDEPTGCLAGHLSEEPTIIYVPLLIHLLARRRCHAHGSCHLGVSRTLR